MGCTQSKYQNLLENHQNIITDLCDRNTNANLVMQRRIDELQAQLNKIRIDQIHDNTEVSSHIDAINTYAFNSTDKINRLSDSIDEISMEKSNIIRDTTLILNNIEYMIDALEQHHPINGQYIEINTSIRIPKTWLFYWNDKKGIFSAQIIDTFVKYYSDSIYGRIFAHDCEFEIPAQIDVTDDLAKSKYILTHNNADFALNIRIINTDTSSSVNPSLYYYSEINKLMYIYVKLKSIMISFIATIKQKNIPNFMLNNKSIDDWGIYAHEQRKYFSS